MTLSIGGIRFLCWLVDKEIMNELSGTHWLWLDYDLIMVCVFPKENNWKSLIRVWFIDLCFDLTATGKTSQSDVLISFLIVDISIVCLCSWLAVRSLLPISPYELLSLYHGKTEYYVSVSQHLVRVTAERWQRQRMSPVCVSPLPCRIIQVLSAGSMKSKSSSPDLCPISAHHSKSAG